MKPKPFDYYRTKPRVAPSVDIRPHVMISPLCGTERHHWINPILSTAIVASSFRQDIRQFSYNPAFGVFPVSAARNKIVEEYFLPSDADWLVQIDNDIAPPQNFLDMLSDCPPEADILIAPYYVWMPDVLRPMLCFGRWENGQMITPESSDIKKGWMPGGGGGTGLIAIRRRVFAEGKLPKPFFRILCNDYEGQTMSEDIYFTSRATEAGYKIFTNADYLVKHFHTLDLAEVNMGVCRLIDQYVGTVREKYGDIGIKTKTLTHELHPELVKESQ